MDTRMSSFFHDSGLLPGFSCYGCLDLSALKRTASLRALGHLESALLFVTPATILEVVGPRRMESINEAD